MTTGQLPRDLHDSIVASGYFPEFVEATVRAFERTGVEMEALTGVSAAALCFYDMCKAIDKGMVIRDIRLIRKTGGKSGEWNAEGVFKV